MKQRGMLAWLSSVGLAGSAVLSEFSNFSSLSVIGNSLRLRGPQVPDTSADN